MSRLAKSGNIDDMVKETYEAKADKLGIVVGKAEAKAEPAPEPTPEPEATPEETVTE